MAFVACATAGALACGAFRGEEAQATAEAGASLADAGDLGGDADGAVSAGDADPPNGCPADAGLCPTFCGATEHGLVFRPRGTEDLLGGPFVGVKNGSPAAGTLDTFVDDGAIDGDGEASYFSAGGGTALVPERVRLVVSPIDAKVLATSTIVSVIVGARVRREAQRPPGESGFRLGLYLGTGNAFLRGTAYMPLAPVYTVEHARFDTDPTTDKPWTGAGLTAAKKVSLNLQFVSGTPAIATRVTQAWLEVCVRP
jgi:hypothetical protein